MDDDNSAIANDINGGKIMNENKTDTKQEKCSHSCVDCGVKNCLTRNSEYPEFCPTAALTDDEIAAAYTRAVLKACAYVAANPEETAQLQIDGEYVSGDVFSNAEILKSYKYIPSVQGGYDALLNVASDLHDIGLLKAETDVSALVGRSFKFFDDVPDSYVYENGAFTAANKTQGKVGNAAEMHDCCG